MKSTEKNLPGERWKIIHLPNDPSDRKRLAISDFGRVKSYSKTGKESLIAGTYQNGYSIIKLKLFSERTESGEKKLIALRKAIARVKAKYESLRLLASNRKAAKQVIATSRKEMAEIKQQLALLAIKYKGAKHDDELGRMINVSFLAHRLVAEKFCKRSPKRDLVIHLDYNKSNNKYSNLKWTNQLECTAHQMKNPNVIKAFKKRKGQRAVNRTSYKLNETNVINIKKQLVQGVKTSKIAKKHDVSETQIKRIARGDNWGNIKVPKK